MKKIIALMDYKNRFGSKHFDSPYRSGMDKQKLQQYFQDNDYDVSFLKFNEINFLSDYKDQLILYTSSEDIGYHYKNYIEDIVYGLELSGAKVIPSFKYLRANNNKVFMEILRNQSPLNEIKNLTSYHFGSLEEIETKLDHLNYPLVFKLAEGASSDNVELINSKTELQNTIKKYCRTKYLKKEIWDLGRSIKHKGYKKESKYRSKFILQTFIPDLVNDWKILIYFDRYYILYREVRKGDFRASGSKNFRFNDTSSIPSQIFDFAESIFRSINVPHASLDICYDGNNFYLIEFQIVYFGNLTMEKSNGYFMREENTWIRINETLELENVYADSIVNYINQKSL